MSWSQISKEIPQYVEVPVSWEVGVRTLSFSVLITAELLISGGMKGAMMEASTRVIGMSVGNVACSIASLSMVSQKSSTSTSSETENSGQVNWRQNRVAVNSEEGEQHRLPRPSQAPSHVNNNDLISHLHVLQLEYVVAVSMCNLKLGGHAADSADHIVVIAHCQALKGPVAAQEELLDLWQLLWTQTVDWSNKRKTQMNSS